MGGAFQFSGQTMTMFTLRPGTLDEYIYRQVIEQNEYGLPDRFSADDIVVDLGAHIGAFAYAALTRGAGKVYGIEPDVVNLEIARRNLRAFFDEGRVSLIHGAAWRSDCNEDVLYFQGYPSMGGSINTGGGRVLDKAVGRAVEKINFDSFLLDITENGKNAVRFLKLDCEGSEWPILFTSRLLNLVSEISGEIHEIRVTGPKTSASGKRDARASFDNLAIDELIDLLERQDFDVKYKPCWFNVPYFERLGMISALRR
jgi:FkbM family methyltransferase